VARCVARLHRDRRTNMRNRPIPASASIRISARQRAHGSAAWATCPVDRHRVLRYPSSMAWPHGALGTDTGGLMPASGGLQRHRRLQADAASVPLDGGVPLSFTLDSFGPLAAHGRCCAVLDMRAANEPVLPLQHDRSRGCGWRCRPRSRSTNSRMRGEDIRAGIGDAFRARAR